MLCSISKFGKCFYPKSHHFLTSSKASAQKALVLHGRDLEADRSLSVFISNPEHKKERTDADANEKVVYVAGLSKFTTKVDLMKIFKTVSRSDIHNE